MNFVTFSDLNKAVCRNMHKIPRDVDLVVGIPRSGMLVASLVGLYLNVPITDIDAFAENKIHSLGETRKNKNWITVIDDARKILIVDDSVSMGEAIKKAKKKVANFPHPKKLIFAAVYTLPSNKNLVDIYFENCSQPRMFEWNYLHHWGMEYACIDIDGVICENPGFFQNDDGAKYIDFLKKANPRFLPTKKVKYIVTSRLEKYRELTEEWLRFHQVQYETLVMGNFESALDRALAGSHGRFKGEIYKKTDCMIFIESDFTQALEICKISGKQVFCTDRNELITPENFFSKMSILKNDLTIVFKHGVRKILKNLGSSD